MQKLCERLNVIAEDLYRGDTGALDRLRLVSEELKEKLLEVALKQTSRDILHEITSCVEKLNEAIENEDKLLTADILYYDIGYILGERDKENNRQETKKDEHDVYEDNISSLEKKDIEHYKSLVEGTEEFDFEDATIATDEYGNIAVLKKDRWWGLNSFYDRNNAVYHGIKSIREKSYIGIMFVMGLGNLDYIREIFKIVPDDMVILIYEPDKRIFAMNMHYNDMRFIIERKNTFLFVKDLNGEKIKDYVTAYSNNVIPKYIYTFISPNYDVLYEDELHEIVKVCNERLIDVMVLENTICSKSENINYNRIKNLSLVMKSVLLSDFKDKLQKYTDMQNATAVVVAAGPSLDKNIQYLKEAKGKAFILAVDSASRMLVKYGIEPDMFITVDPNKEKVLFDNDLMRNVPLLYVLWSTYNNIYNLKGKKFFGNVDGVSDLFLKKIGKKEESLDTGGNVANVAISVASYLGFENIIAIGLDLAFKNDKKHASVVYDDGGINEEESGQYTYVEDQNGELLLTYKNFMLYKKWIEDKISNEEIQNFVNATEGGALIKGASLMTFQEAIKKYCKTDVDYSRLISECTYSFTEEERQKGHEIQQKCIEECEETKVLFQECSRLYNMVQKQGTTENVREILHNIDEIHKEADKKFVMTIITDYALRQADKELDIMYQQLEMKKDSNQELQQIAERGVKISQIYIECADKAKSIFATS